MAQQPPTSIPPQPPSAPGSSQLGGPSIDPQQQIDQLVSQYLKKKGYDKTLQQLQEEARLMPLETYIAHLGLQQVRSCLLFLQTFYALIVFISDATAH